MTTPEVLETSIQSATEALLGFQQSDGHWVFELEADCTIPSEYVMLRHYLGEAVDSVLEAKIGRYLRRIQGAHGGWPLVHDGPFDMSASVKGYFALRLIGDSVDAPHMVRAREAIRSRGGAIHCNVFTRFTLALFGIVSWRAVPVLPVEIMLLPYKAPFHLNKIAYWARTTLVPLLVLAALKPRARNPKGVGISELFLQDPHSIGMTARAPHQSLGWFLLFRGLDVVLRLSTPFFPKKLRQRAIDAALAFTEERINGEDGMGAIFPPMANIVMMYDALGKDENFPPRALTRRGLDRLLVIGDDEAYCQPCVSPVWDTSLVCHTLLEAGNAVEATKQGLDWLIPRQVLDLKGDWVVKRPDVRPGGWAFQYNNPHYPDLDDTAVVVMSLDRMRREHGAQGYDAAIARGVEWIEGMQSDDGGWAAFDVNNLEYYLNNIPFSDHGALLDPPTEDVTARCLSMLGQLGQTLATGNRAVAAGIAYLRRTQHKEGSWYGRWGLNFIYGTWSVLCGLNAAGIDHSDPMIRKAVEWLASIQNSDGGWGEDAVSYRLDYKGWEKAPSTPSQTGWALLALMAVGEADHPAVARGVQYLIATQNKKGLWSEERYTATGFPRVFYLRYHGYAKFFPLWALARYRNLRSTNSRVVGVGM